MTFGVTSEGFKAKKFADIIAELSESLNTELGVDIDSDPDSIAKVITNIYALALADEWALPQALQSMFDIDKAEGKHLDDLVGYIGLSRLSAAKTTGKQYISANNELTVPANSVFKDIDDNEFLNSGEIFVGLLSCVDCRLEPNDSVIIGNILSVTVNGVTSSVTVTTSVSSAISILANSINSADNGAVAGVIAGQINIAAVDDTLSMVITTTSNLDINSVSSFGTVSAPEVGDIGVGANQVTIPPALGGIVSTTNRYAYTTGRFQETDQDLRNRHSLSLSTAGAATVEAIRADILRVSGVSAAFVLENDTLVTDVNNIPPKAFLAIVKGGEAQDIGESIWTNKPAGIETYGNINVTVVDSQGDNQSVSFSRPNEKYIHMRVDYTIYSEESGDFPTDGEDQMLNQIIAYGDGLDVGEDVIPQRFSSQIFQNVGGLQRVDIYIGSTVSPNDPTPTLTNVTLPIDALSEANFSEARITFVEV